MEFEPVSAADVRPTADELAATYKPGSIVRVRLRDFLTYANVEFRPGPRLNVVIGPNGTGKSTILCAICLGLGGEPPLLGRADDARTFIMHEKEVAIIEIELAPARDKDGKPGPINTVRRLIERNKGTERGRGKGASTFYINGEVVNKKEVTKLVQETYLLSVDNLCTFLPQDRVGSFSGFDSKQLLIETEKSMSGTKHLFTTHEELIVMEKEIRQSTGSVETIGDKLKELEEEAQGLELQKEKMEERREAEKQINLLEQKLAWLKFDEKRQESIELKEEKAQAKKKLQDARRSIQPLMQAASDAEEEAEQAKANRKDLESSIKKSQKSQENNMKKYDTHGETIEDCLNDLNELDSTKQKLQRKVDKEKKALAKVESDFADAAEGSDLDALKKDLQDIMHEFKSARKESTKAKTARNQAEATRREKDRDVKRLEARLERLNDEKAQRLDRILNDRFLKLDTRAYEWIQQNQKHFRSPVIGPIAKEITNVENEITARILESHVPNAAFKTYITQNREDFNYIYREVREKRKYPINLMIVQDVVEPNRIYSPDKMAELQRKHGISKYLDQAIEAHPIVKQALMNAAQIDQVVLGNDRTQNSMDVHDLKTILATREDGSVKQACVSTTKDGRIYKYNITVSRYSGKVGVRTDDLDAVRGISPKFLKRGVDPDAVKALQQEIDGFRSALQQLIPTVEEKDREYQALMKETQELQKRGKDIDTEIKNLNVLEKKVKNAHRKVGEAEKEVVNFDGESEKKGITKKLMNGIKAQVTCLENAGSHYDEGMASTYRLCGVKMNDSGVMEKARLLKEAIADKENESHALEASFEDISRQFSEAKQMLKELRAEATELTGGEMTGTIKAKLEGFPESVDEVEALLTDAQDKVNSIDDNPEVLRRYEQRTKEIAEARAKLEDLNEGQNAKIQQLEHNAGNWKTALHNSLEKVNVLFQKYMQELGCAGEVRLRKGSSEHSEDSLGDFANWGVEIRVKFREKSPLQVLSAHHHSGGERSVSTIMYLMALQDLMVSPFRCVDEINQGLDERNERLVFKRIVENSTRPPQEEGAPHTHIGQYFLITPKLLPNLTAMENDDVTMLCIFNGPMNFDFCTDWNVEKFLADRKRFRAGSSNDDSDDDDEDGYARGTAQSDDDDEDAKPKSKKKRKVAK